MLRLIMMRLQGDRAASGLLVQRVLGYGRLLLGLVKGLSVLLTGNAIAFAIGCSIASVVRGCHCFAYDLRLLYSVFLQIAA